MLDRYLNQIAKENGAFSVLILRERCGILEKAGHLVVKKGHVKKGQVIFRNG